MTTKLFPDENWRISSRCKADSDMCVAVAVDTDTVGVKDTKNPHSDKVITFSAQAWQSFTHSV